MSEKPKFSVQKRKIEWFVEQGGTIVGDSEYGTVVKYRSGFASIDLWGRVVWMTKLPHGFTPKQG